MSAARATSAHRGGRCHRGRQKQNKAMGEKVNDFSLSLFHVITGLVPAIHVLSASKTWMPGTGPGMTRTGASWQNKAIQGNCNDFNERVV